MMVQLALAASVVVLSFLGTTRRIGFWGTFFASILLTPLGGLLLLFISGPAITRRRHLRRAWPARSSVDSPQRLPRSI
ncbi:MAG: hypothetical protein RL685_1434 [Pseudomonadota bacterium]|jgi:hypothetical protein